MTEIIHIVSWRLNGETPQIRGQQAQTIVKTIQAMQGRVAGLLSLDVGVNVVEAADAWDVGAVMVFRSRACLDAYQVHPEHLILKDVVAPLRGARSQLDFERASPLNNEAERKGQ